MKIIEDINNCSLLPCVATIGCFDGVHCGHRFLVSQVIDFAHKNALQSALITFTVHPRQVMQSDYHPKLLSCLQQKTELISKLDADYCFLMPFTMKLSKLSAYDFMKYLRDTYNVHALVIGYDHRFGHNRTEGFEDYQLFGQRLGIDVIRAQALIRNDLSISSSLIRSLLKEGRIEEANDYLGYNYYINGTVVGGFRNGRKIGFPTANLQPSCKDKLLPANGVYAIQADIDGQQYSGMLNIGRRPTLNNGDNVSIEANIFNFSEDIYHQSIRIQFLKYIRPEKKFQNIKELTMQLRHDKQIIQHMTMPTIE